MDGWFVAIQNVTLQKTTCKCAQGLLVVKMFQRLCVLVFCGRVFFLNFCGKSLLLRT